MINIFVHCISGIDNIQASLPEDTTIGDLYTLLEEKLPTSIWKQSHFTLVNGNLLPRHKPNEKLLCCVPLYNSSEYDYIDIRHTVKLCGGKGGFGSMLRAQGGRMARKKSGKKRPEENDNYRSLDGRRMKSIRQAKELVAYLETAPGYKKQAIEKKKAKLKAIINAPAPNKDSKFTDTKFLEESETILEEIKKSVNHAMNDPSDLEEEEEEEEEVSSFDKCEPSTSSSSIEVNADAAPQKKPLDFGSFFDYDDDSDVSEEEEQSNDKGKSKE